MAGHGSILLKCHRLMSSVKVVFKASMWPLIALFALAFEHYFACHHKILQAKKAHNFNRQRRCRYRLHGLFCSLAMVFRQRLLPLANDFGQVFMRIRLLLGGPFHHLIGVGNRHDARLVL